MRPSPPDRAAPPPMSRPRDDARVCVGAIAAAHGIKGEVKIKTFTGEAMSVGAYGPLSDEAGARRFDVDSLRPAGNGLVIAKLSGVADRNAAEALRGLRLYVPRAALPATDEGEFYHHDLIGLRAELAGGDALGTVVAVHNFGAGDMIEIERVGAAPLVVPFTDAAVPRVDLAAGVVVVDPPPGLLEDPEPEGDRA